METFLLFLTAISWVAVIVGGCIWTIGLICAAMSLWAGRLDAMIACLWVPICTSLFPVLGACWLYVSRH